VWLYRASIRTSKKRFLSYAQKELFEIYTAVILCDVTVKGALVGPVVLKPILGDMREASSQY